jgi:type VI secretion system protein ImpH
VSVPISAPALEELVQPSPVDKAREENEARSPISAGADTNPGDLLDAAGLLLQQLREAPQGFDFFTVMRRLEAKHPTRTHFGRSVRPAEDLIRLGQEPAVTHAPAALAGFDAGTEGRAGRLLVHFFGLFGPDGPLPLHLTEYVRDRRRNHADAAPQRFIDLFHHRALSLFYRAWADVRPTVNFDRPEEDRFSHYVGAFVGLSTPGLRDRDAMPDLSKLHFAGLLANQTRHAEGLGQILSSFFTVPVQVESFRGAWLSLPRSDHSRLSDGAATAELGKSVVLGSQVWSRQHKFRLVFGPLSLEEYERLLPGGLSFHRLVPIVRNYAGDALIWDVNLILHAADVPKTCLGRQGRLGWTTWLMPRRATADAADLNLDASADSHASAVNREKVGHVSGDDIA